MTPGGAPNLVFTGFGAAMLAGAATGLGRPGIDVVPATFVGVGLLCLIAVGSSWLRAVIYAVGFGIGLFTVITWGSMTWGPIVPAMLTAIAVGLYALPLALWVRFAGPRLSPSWLFAATAAAWVLCMDVGDLLGYPLKVVTLSLLAHAPVCLAGARLVGINILEGLMTAALVVGAQQFAIAPRQPARRFARRLFTAPAATLVLVAILAAIARTTAGSAAGQIRVGIPQMDADSVYYESRMTAPAVVETFSQRLQDLLAKLRDVDLVVTSESFDGRFGLLIPSVRQAWQVYAAAHKQAILLGSYVVEPNGWKANAVGAFSAAGQWVGVSRKVDLAPYGERHLAAGTRYEPLPVFSNFSIGSMLCQEAILPRAPRTLTRGGAALLSVGTNDATFGSTVIVFDHLGLAQERAIEVGRSIVWATNGGPSSLIDRWGVLHPYAPLAEPAAAKFAVPLFLDRTPFMQCTAVWSALSALVLGGVLAFGKKRATAAPAPRARPNRRALAGRVAVQLVMVACACALWFVSPALVEMARGAPERAEDAVKRVFARPEWMGTRDPFARFRTDVHGSAAGALAYYLSYYGEELPSSSVHASDVRSLEELRVATSLHVPSRLVSLHPHSLPRVATLVQALDGTFEVMTRATGEGDAQLFSPVTGLSTAASPDKLLSIVQGSGIIPAPLRCDALAGCHAEP